MIKYEDIVDIDKIEEMYNVIKINTRNKGKLFNYKMFYMTNICNIYRALESKSYTHGKYNIFLIYEPKKRIIMSERLSDKIVNHLISKYVLEPVILPKLINTNVATRINLGTKAGIDYFKKYVNKLKINNDSVYVLKMDIKKYFFNIDHEILLNKIKDLGYDEDIMNIIRSIIKSTDSNYVEREVNKYDNKLYCKGKMIPIGNMTSQLLAIFYLNDLDHFIKEILRCKYYIRYMDDLVILDGDTNKLKAVRDKVREEINKLKLVDNSKTIIANLKNGFNFLGYRYILSNKKLIIKIINRNKYRIRKRINDNNRGSYKGYLMISNVSLEI